MEFIVVPAGTHDLGWRYTDRLPRPAADSLREIGMLAPQMPWFSEARRVTLPRSAPRGDGHTKPNARGLKLNANPYRVELVRHALKLGDGGRSICGGDSWPVAWFGLAPCFRLREEDVADCFVETLEEAYVRPVRVGEERRIAPAET
jgi:hypothetical protein